jgi:hypothetical protein
MTFLSSNPTSSATQSGLCEPRMVSIPHSRADGAGIRSFESTQTRGCFLAGTRDRPSAFPLRPQLKKNAQGAVEPRHGSPGNPRRGF